MAKIVQGVTGGFSGSVGPVVGYQWRGRWCMRSHPRAVRNPRTEAQQEHRQMFKEEVQLASRMNWVLKESFNALSLAEGLTPCNFFIRENQHAFAWSDERLTVDWASLRLSMGPVAPVAFGVPELTEETLTVAFEKNPLHVRADVHDKVYLYVYCPEAEQGYLAAPVYRHTQRVSVVLPRTFAGRELHLWGLVEDRQGRWSESVYIGFDGLTHDSLTPNSLTPGPSPIGEGGSLTPGPSPIGEGSDGSLTSPSSRAGLTREASSAREASAASSASSPGAIPPSGEQPG